MTKLNYFLISLLICQSALGVLKGLPVTEADDQERHTYSPTPPQNDSDDDGNDENFQRTKKDAKQKKSPAFDSFSNLTATELLHYAALRRFNKSPKDAKEEIIKKRFLRLPTNPNENYDDDEDDDDEGDIFLSPEDVRKTFALRRISNNPETLRKHTEEILEMLDYSPDLLEVAHTDYTIEQHLNGLFETHIYPLIKNENDVKPLIKEAHRQLIQSALAHNPTAIAFLTLLDQIKEISDVRRHQKPKKLLLRVLGATLVLHGSVEKDLKKDNNKENKTFMQTISLQKKLLDFLVETHSQEPPAEETTPSSPRFSALFKNKAYKGAPPLISPDLDAFLEIKEYNRQSIETNGNDFNVQDDTEDDLDKTITEADDDEEDLDKTITEADDDEGNDDNFFLQDNSDENHTLENPELQKAKIRQSLLSLRLPATKEAVQEQWIAFYSPLPQNDNDNDRNEGLHLFDFDTTTQDDDFTYSDDENDDDAYDYDWNFSDSDDENDDDDDGGV